MTARFLIALCCAWAASAAAADTAYVTDMLQLGLHRAEDTSDRAFMNLVSGTRLEVLERRTHYARVRTDDGDEGWVKTAYIVADVPPRFLLAALEAEVESLRAQLHEARATEKRATQEAARLLGLNSEQVQTEQALRETVARLEHENTEYSQRIDGHRMSLPLLWVIGALGLALAGGGFGGWWGLDLLIRRRHAGYRIY